MTSDQRPDSVKQPRGPGDLLARGGTATRADYEGRGLVRYLAEHEMHYAAGLGFRAIHIGAGADAVQRVWENPPQPYKSTVLAETLLYDLHVPDMQTGAMLTPFPGNKQRVAYIWCQLKHQE